MQEHYDNPGTGATAESTLDELFGTLWANAMRQKKGEPKHEQNVGTVHRRRRAAQMW